MTFTRWQLVSLVCGLGLSVVVHSEQHVWLVGSGPNLENTQVQIERNLQWAHVVLAELPGTRHIEIYFSDGRDALPDITEWQAPAEAAEQLQPLARVYDSYYLNGERVRNHAIDGVRGAATRQTLRTALTRGLRGLAEGDEAVMVYVGHGTRAADESRLDLWGGVPLTQRELRGLFDAQPDGTRVRVVMTQCYAGGFQAAVLAAPMSMQRCGFYAVGAEQLAEGCTSSLNVADYRGYSTYFFAALGGRTRTGEALPFPADRDADGRVDPYEAHLYTLRAARSLDIPRSSSEQFLLDWEPWYLPLMSIETQPDNVHAQIAHALFNDLGLKADSGRYRPVLAVHRKQVQAQIRRLLYRQEQSRTRAAAARDQLRLDLELRWPGARYPYTRAFRDFLVQDLDAAQAFIEHHPLYRDLVADQDAYWTLDRAIIELQRRVGQLDRVLHLLRLARLQSAFEARAGHSDRARYQALLACERHPL